MSEITLKTDGLIHSGWEQISIQASLETIADSFSMTLSDRWTQDSKPRTIRYGAPATVTIDGEDIITGHIDDIYPSYDAVSHTIEVAGRSKAGDLVDCTLAARQFKNQTFDKLAKAVCDPFDINVIVNTDIGAPFPIASIDAGQSPFEFLQEYARYRALRLVSIGDGNIEITRTGVDRISTPLELGNNVLSAQGEFSLRNRFDKYTVLGQSSGSDLSWGNATSGIKGTYDDKTVKRHRPAVLLAEGSITRGDAKKRAQWECNTRFGRGQAVVYTVLGWKHKDGIWKPNTLVPVKDEYLDIDEDRLIVAVQYILDETGERAEIQVMPKEAFDLVALPDPQSSGGWQL